MAAPSAEELAAIAVAYLVATRAHPSAEDEVRASRWALAARLPDAAGDGALLGARTTRWNAAGRADG